MSLFSTSRIPDDRNARGGTRPRSRRCRVGAEQLEGRQLLAVAIGETPIPTPQTSYGLLDIANGPDGNVWYTRRQLTGGAPGRIGRVTPHGTITEFVVPSDAIPDEITAGPDGNLWFIDNVFPLTTFPTGVVYPAPSPQSSFVVRITPTGDFTEFPIPQDAGRPHSITAGPDGNLWVGSDAGINRITTDGVVTRFTLPSNGQPSEITAGPDGNLWFTEADGSLVGRITTAGAITEFSVPAAAAGDLGYGIATGPDGNLWFLVGNQLTNRPGHLERITPAGVVTDFAIPDSGADLAAGGDGALWITGLGDRIIRFALDGSTAVYQTPSTYSSPYRIVAGPDGTLWFTENYKLNIGRLFPDAVDDGSLVVTTSFPSAVTEAQTFDGAVATFTDAHPGSVAGDFIARINWGDGVFTIGTVTADGAGGFVVHAAHAYYKQGSYSILVTISDATFDAPRRAVAGSTTTVANVPLTPISIDRLVFRGQLDPIVVGFADAVDGTGTYTATIDWGDGTTSAGTIESHQDIEYVFVAGSVGPAPRLPSAPEHLKISGSHVYANDGWYVVKVHIVDETGLETTVVSQVQYATPTASDTRGLDVSSRPGVSTGLTTLATFSMPSPTLDVSRFSATINWGDGTAPSTGTVFYAGLFTYVVVGSHVYAKAGDYDFRVTISGLGAPFVLDGSAHFAPPPPFLTGDLSQASDTGVSKLDGITSNSRPTFVGLADPGTTVRLYAWPNGTGKPFAVGRAVADAHGHWSVVSKTLPDGSYAISAHASSADGRRASTRVGVGRGRLLVVDTVGPKVAGVRLDPGNGAITIDFSERGDDVLRGYTIATRYPFQQVAGSGAVPVAVSKVSVAPSGRSVSLRLASPLSNGLFALRVVAAGIQDVAGNALDGEFAGTFTTGDDRPGGDFVGLFNVTDRRIVGPTPLAGTSSSSPRGPLTSASSTRRRPT